MTDVVPNATDLQHEVAAFFDEHVLGLPYGISSSASARLVECIVQAAVLRMAELQSQYAATGQTADVHG